MIRLRVAYLAFMELVEPDILLLIWGVKMEAKNKDVDT